MNHQRISQSARTSESLDSESTLARSHHKTASLKYPPLPDSKVLGARGVDHSVNETIAQYGRLPVTSRVHKYVAQRLDIVLKDFPLKEPPQLVVLARKGFGINAFATYRGAIVVSPEMLGFLKHTEELDFVLLHEAAHLAFHHHKAINDAHESGSLLKTSGQSRLSEYEADLQAFLALAHPARDSSPIGAILALERFNQHAPDAWDIAHGTLVDRIMNLKTCTIFRDLNTEGALPGEAGSLSCPLRNIPLLVRKDIEGLKSGNLVYTIVRNPRLDGDIHAQLSKVSEAIRSADIPSLRWVVPELCAAIEQQKARAVSVSSRSREHLRLDLQLDAARQTITKLIQEVSDTGFEKSLSPQETERLLGIELLLAGMTRERAKDSLTDVIQNKTKSALERFARGLDSTDALEETHGVLSLIEGSIRLEQAQKFLSVVAESALIANCVFDVDEDDSIDIHSYLSHLSRFADTLASSTFSDHYASSEISTLLKAESFIILAKYLLEIENGQAQEAVRIASEMNAPFLREPSILRSAVDTMVERTGEKELALKLQAFARTDLALPEVKTSLAKFHALLRETAPLIKKVSNPTEAEAALKAIEEHFQQAYQIAKNLPSIIAPSMLPSELQGDLDKEIPLNRLYVIQSIYDDAISTDPQKVGVPSFKDESRLFLLKTGLLHALSANQLERDEISSTLEFAPEVKIPRFEELIDLLDEIQSERPESLIRQEPLPARQGDPSTEIALHDAIFESLVEELFDSTNPLSSNKVLERLTVFATRSVIATPSDGESPGNATKMHFRILELGARALREKYPFDRTSEDFLRDALVVSLFIPSQGPARLIQRELILRLIDSAGSEKVARQLFERFRPQRGWLSLETLEKLDEASKTISEIKTVAQISKDHILVTDEFARKAGKGVMVDFFFSSQNSRLNFHDLLFKGLSSASDDTAITESIVDRWWSLSGDEILETLHYKISPIRTEKLSPEQVNEIIDQVADLTPSNISLDLDSNYRFALLSNSEALTPQLIRSSMYCLGMGERLVALRKLANDPSRGTLISPEKREKVAEGLLNQMLATSEQDRLTDVCGKAFRALFRAVPADDLGIALTPMLLDQFLKAPPESASFRPIAEAHAQNLFADLGLEAPEETGLETPLETTLSESLKERLLSETTNYFEWALSGRNPRTEQSVSKGIDDLMEICDITFSDRVALDRRGPIPFILDFSKNLQTPGTRALQLLGGIVELPPEMEREFLQVYDARRGQSKQSALRTIEKILPEYASQLTTLKRIGGGALYSVFVAELSSGGREVIRVANPNPEYHTQRILHSMRAAQTQLEREDSDFAIGRHVIDLVDQWISAELRDSTFESDDKAFREQWNGWTPAQECPLAIHVPESYLTGSLHVRREEFIPGRNFTELSEIAQESPHLAKSAVAIAIQHYVSQIYANELSPGDSLVHSDISPGNLRLMDGGKVALLDRSMYLKFSLEDRLLLMNVMAAASAEERARSLTEGLTTLQEREVSQDEVQLVIDQVTKALKTEDSVEKTLLKGLLAAQQAGLLVPLRFQLLVKNLNSFRVMAEKVGFHTIEEALTYDWS